MFGLKCRDNITSSMYRFDFISHSLGHRMSDWLINYSITTKLQLCYYINGLMLSTILRPIWRTPVKVAFVCVCLCQRKIVSFSSSSSSSTILMVKCVWLLADSNFGHCFILWIVVCININYNQIAIAVLKYMRAVSYGF